MLFQSTEWTAELSPGWSEVRAEPWVDRPTTNEPAKRVAERLWQ